MSTDSEVVNLFDKLDELKSKKAEKVNIAIIGSKGSGKTTLAHCLANKEKTDLLLHKDLYDNLEGIKLTVCDTQGLEDDAKKILKRFKYVSSWSSWIYCINMKEENFDNEIILMQDITDCFGREMWNRATIVLTFANEVSAGQDLSIYEARLRSWTGRVHGFMKDKVKPKEKVPVIIAGLPGKVILQSDPEGTSWLNDIWLSLLLRANFISQPHIMKFVLRNLFKAPKISGKQLVHFLTSHHLIFAKIINHDFKFSDQHNRLKAIQACSFWHAIGIMFANHLAIQNRLSVNVESECLSYWEKNISTQSVNIMVAGERGSGKTSLINSLFYGNVGVGKDGILSEKDNSAHPVAWEVVRHKHYEVECRVRDTSGIIDQDYYDALKQAYTENEFHLLFYCISIYEDILGSEAKIQKLTDSLGKDVWKKTVVVFTFANCFDSGVNCKVEIAKREKSIKSIFQKLLEAENIPIPEIVSAGYHNYYNVNISGDLNHFWCIDLWRKAIFVAEANSHTSLLTLLHTNSSLHENWNMNLKKNTQQVTIYYKETFIEILCLIVSKYKLFIVKLEE